MQQLNKWFYIFSPCIVAGIFCVMGMIQGFIKGNQSMGWSYLGAMILGIVLLSLLIVDVIVKLIFKRNTPQVWMIEMVCMGMAVIVFRYYY